jgi:hypothetical protein
MTLGQAISTIDARCHNVYEYSDKVRWLSELDGMIKLEIIDTHEGGGETPFSGYKEGADEDTELLVPHPWDDLYIKWLESRIDYENKEFSRYNNSVSAFNAAYSAFAKWYNRTHMPKSESFKY